MAPWLRVRTPFVSQRTRKAWAETRSFERCAPTSPWHDCPHGLAPPLRAHGPCIARIFALDHIHGRTVWGGCGGWGLACGSLTIHPHHGMGHNGWSIIDSLSHAYTPSAGLSDFDGQVS